ncbi:MAG: hypothetical protein AAB600_01955 [Patescibacteria group bacterium]
MAVANLQPQLLTWHDALTIAVIIFAITQFMETTRLRRYLFYLGWLRTVTVVLVGLPIILVIIANAPPSSLFPVISFVGSSLGHFVSYICQASLYCTLPMLYNFLQLHISIPQSFLTNAGNVLNQPSVYEVAALLLFSLLILLYLAFLKNPQWFKPFFNTKLLDAMSWELLDNMRGEDLAALCKIIGSYLEKLVSLASKVPRPLSSEIDERRNFKNQLAIRCLQFINIDLSGANFIDYISRQNVKFIIRMLQYAKKYSFWNTEHSIFFDNLFAQLMRDKNSVLTREFKLGGYSGVAQPLSNAIFKSMEIVDNYDVFGALGWSAGISDITLSNTITGLDMALRKYFTTNAGAYLGNPGIKLGSATERLAQCYNSMCMDIAKQGEEIWKNKHASKMSQLMRFFIDFEYRLTPVSDTRWQEAYRPTFSQQDLEVQKYTFAEGLVEALFKLYEGISWLKHEGYARMEAIEPYWLVFHDPQNQMIKALQDKFLEKVKERVGENFKGHYPSMLKVFLSLYGGELYGDLRPQSNNPIIAYFREMFKNRIVPALRNDKKFKEHNMPSDWQFDKQNNIYRMSYGEEKIIIDKKTKKKKNKSAVKTKRIKKSSKKK